MTDKAHEMIKFLQEFRLGYNIFSGRVWYDKGLLDKAAQLIQSQSARIAELEAERTEIAELIGACAAGKCQADMWADPPRDCCAPDCLDPLAGAKKIKKDMRELEAQRDELAAEARQLFEDRLEWRRSLFGCENSDYQYLVMTKEYPTIAKAIAKQENTK